MNSNVCFLCVTGFMSKVLYVLLTTDLQTDLFPIWPSHEAGSGNTSATASVFLLLQTVSLQTLWEDIRRTFM